MSYGDVDVKRLLEAYGRSQLEVYQLRLLDAATTVRTRDLEQTISRLIAENALLTATCQKDIETVRMNRTPAQAEELIPDTEVAQPEQPPTVRIIRSRTRKGENPALFLGSE